MDSLFYPEFRRIDFRLISRPTCQIVFFIRKFKLLFYPDLVRNRSFRYHDWKWIKKRKFSKWNPDKKRIWQMIGKCSEIFLSKSGLTNPSPWLALFHKLFRIKQLPSRYLVFELFSRFMIILKRRNELLDRLSDNCYLFWIWHNFENFRRPIDMICQNVRFKISLQ